MPTKRHTLRFLILFLSIPTLLCAQQNKSPANVPTPVAASTAAQPVIANPKTPAEFFARARQLSDLEAAGIPFHLKATYVATEDRGFSGNGTIEEWWQSKNVWRKEATFGRFRLVQISDLQGSSIYATSPDIPPSLSDALGGMLVKITSGEETSDNWQVKQKKIGGIKLTVVFTGPRRESDGTIHSGRAYYFTQVGILRMRQASVATVYNTFQSFKTLLIPREIVITKQGIKILAVSIETLESLDQSPSAAANLISAPKDLPLLGKDMVLAGDETEKNCVSHPFPQYPEIAKQIGAQGDVSLAAIIDNQGKVRYLHVIKSASPVLNSASLVAVRQWRCKPTIINGKPVEVEATFTVAFALNN